MNISLNCVSESHLLHININIQTVLTELTGKMTLAGHLKDREKGTDLLKRSGLRELIWSFLCHSFNIICLLMVFLVFL